MDVTDHAQEPGSDEELTYLAETYAIRVRELSDAVAIMGRLIAARQKIGENITEVKRLKALVEQASEELFGGLESRDNRRRAASSAS